MAKHTGKVKLEIGLPPAGLPNLIRNSYGELGSWQYVTPVTNTELTSRYNITGDLRFRSLTTQPAHFVTEYQPVAAGRWVQARVNITGGYSFSLTLEFANADKVALAPSAGPIQTTSGPVYSPKAQAPANTAYVRLRLDMFSTSGGAGPLANQFMQFNEVMITHAATSGAIPSGFGFNPAYVWTDILGTAYSIKSRREVMNVGSLEVSFDSPSLEPSINDTLSQGRPIRIVAQPYPGDSWTARFTGAIDKASSDGQGRIEITALDNFTHLSNQGESRGVSTIADLAFLLEGKGAPWLVNGNSTQPSGNPTVVSNNTDASVIDQILITRDTNLGYAWVDHDGIMNVNSTLSNTLLATFSDVAGAGVAGYLKDNGIDIGWDSEDCINVVTVNYLRYNVGTQDTQSIAYGPFKNQASIDKWGARSAEYTIGGSAANDNEAFAKAYANTILNNRATPQVRCKSVTVPVKDDASMLAATYVDLYTLVRVKRGTYDQNLRVTGIEDNITPDSWSTTYAFAVENSVANPNFVPAPPAIISQVGVLEFNPASQSQAGATGWSRMTGGGITITVPGTYLIQFTAAFGTGTAGTVGRRGVGVSTVDGSASVDVDMNTILHSPNNASGTYTFTGFKELSAGAVITPWRYNDVVNHYSAGNGYLRAVKVA